MAMVFASSLTIVHLPLAAQSSPDVTDVLEVDATPLGMYVAT